MANRNRRRVNPRDIKKRSDYAPKKHDKSLLLVGDRVSTDTGYKIPGMATRSFDTFYEVMLPGTCTHKLMHPKKDKSLWIVSGQGFLEIKREGEPESTRVSVIPGDHLEIPRKAVYKLFTTANQSLEAVVVQQYKYDGLLEVVEESGSFKEATEEQMKVPSQEDRMKSLPDFSRRSGKSKAVEQQQRMASKRKSRQQQGPPQAAETASVDRMGFSRGINPRPLRNLDGAG